MNRQLYIDLDGVLADFDGHYEALFGIRPDRSSEEAMQAMDFREEFWARIRNTPDFFRTMPRMIDCAELWLGSLRYHAHPIILTGLPHSIQDVEVQKRAWVAENIGIHARVICTTSKRKYEHCQPGDALIDDWSKYRKNWEDAGGIFILHKSAHESLASLETLCG